MRRRVDLKAVDHRVTPWVVSVGHKFYSMDTLNWQPYEDMLNPGGVDLHLCMSGGLRRRGATCRRPRRDLPPLARRSHLLPLLSHTHAAAP